MNSLLRIILRLREFRRRRHVAIYLLQDSKPGEVDLHGLYVKEAIAYTDQSILEARARGDTEIRLIVGESGFPYKRQTSSKQVHRPVLNLNEPT